MSVLKTNSEGLIPVELSAEVIQGVVKGSAIMSNSKIKEMTTSEVKLNAIEGVEAFKVGEGQAITKSDAKFPTVSLKADKYASIVVVSNEVLNESIADVMAEIQVSAVEQFQRAFDKEAVKNILASITASGQSVAVGNVAGQSLYEDISDMMALVEAHGYDVNTFLANFSYKNDIRKLRDSNGNALYLPTGAGTPDEFFGQNIAYNFGVDRATTELVGGDFKYSVAGIQGQLQYKVLTEATIQGISLAETDQIAIRLILPMAHAITKNDAFASLTPKATV